MRCGKYREMFVAVDSPPTKVGIKPPELEIVVVQSFMYQSIFDWENFYLAQVAIFI